MHSQQDEIGEVRAREHEHEHCENLGEPQSWTHETKCLAANRNDVQDSIARIASEATGDLARFA